MNLAEQLIEDKFLVEFGKALAEKGKVYVVGGYPRDLVLGKRSLDIDFVVIGDLREFLAPALKFNPVSWKRSEFLTLKFIFEGGRIVDVAHARKEQYPEPAALPKVSRAETIEEDLWRRDFTINSMAISLNRDDFGELIDPTGGLSDLKKGIIRVLKEGSFRDDPTRAYRALRYSVRFSFQLDSVTEREFDLARQYLPKVSFERIKNELKRGAEEEKRALYFKRSEEEKLFTWPHRQQKLSILEELDRILGDRKEEHWVAFFAAFLGEKKEALKLISTLPLTRHERKFLHDFLKVRDAPQLGSFSEFHISFRNCTEEAIKTAAAVLPYRRDFLLGYLERKKKAKPLVCAEELIEMGFKGKEIGKALLSIELQRIDGKLSSYEEEIRFLRGWRKS